jgi:hypothetical protein
MNNNNKKEKIQRRPTASARLRSAVRRFESWPWPIDIAVNLLQLTSAQTPSVLYII